MADQLFLQIDDVSIDDPKGIVEVIDRVREVDVVLAHILPTPEVVTQRVAVSDTVQLKLQA